MKISRVVASALLTFGLNAHADQSPSFVVKATPSADGRVYFDVCEAAGLGVYQKCTSLTDKTYSVADLQDLQAKADQNMRAQIAEYQKVGSTELTATQKFHLAGVVVGVIVLAVATGFVVFGGFALMIPLGTSAATIATGVIAAGAMGAYLSPAVPRTIQEMKEENIQARELYLQQNNRNYEYIKAMSNILKRIDLPQDSQVRSVLVQQLQDTLKAVPSQERESILLVPGKG